MWGFIAFFALVLIVVAVLKGLAENPRHVTASEVLPFEKAPPLFSPAERSFYGVLEQAIGDEYRIFAKVRLGDVIQPKRGLERSPFTTALNKVNKKHLDYIICGKTDFSTVGAIELDDKSHQRRDRQERDAFVDCALEAAGIPIIHFTAKTTYSVQDVRLNIANAFSLSLKELKPSASSADTIQTVSVQEPEIKEFKLFSSDEKGADTPAPSVVDAPKVFTSVESCPDCGSKMIVKKVSKGPHAGRPFWVCVKYPGCKNIMPLDNKLAAEMDF